jgi:hypothetical protein
MEEAPCKVKIMRDYKGNLNSIFVKEDTLKEKKLSHAKHGKRNQQWREEETQQNGNWLKNGRWQTGMPWQIIQTQWLSVHAD